MEGEVGIAATSGAASGSALACDVSGGVGGCWVARTEALDREYGLQEKLQASGCHQGWIASRLFRVGGRLSVARFLVRIPVPGRGYIWHLIG